MFRVCVCAKVEMNIVREGERQTDERIERQRGRTRQCICVRVCRRYIKIIIIRERERQRQRQRDRHTDRDRQRERRTVHLCASV